MKRNILAIILVISSVLAATACGRLNSQPSDVSSASSKPSESIKLTVPQEESVPPSSAQESSDTEVTYYTDENNWPEGPNIDGAPVEDLQDLKSVTEVYVWPLTINGSTWFQSWASPSEIDAGMLIYICAFNGWVEYDASDATVQPFAPAEEVEAALQKHFDVTIDYLRSSTTYNAENNTYPMTEGGGGWAAVAMTAEQEDNLVTVKVGSLGPEETIPTFRGTLVVELTDHNVVRYVSYHSVE